MRKRINFVNREELAAKQEIKNYQDSLNFVLQSIRELKESVQHVNQEQLENYAALHSAYIGLQGEYSSLKDLIFSYGLRLERSERDQKVLIDKNTESITDIEEDLRNKVNTEQILQSELSSLLQRFSSLRTTVEMIEHKISQDVSSISTGYHKDIQRMKEEILNSPCKSELVRKELNEKIDSHKVDVAGIMRELGIYKHENYITEKKIENLYTLIERLQKAVVYK